jgi:hypothetical protein
VYASVVVVMGAALGVVVLGALGGAVGGVDDVVGADDGAALGVDGVDVVGGGVVGTVVVGAVDGGGLAACAESNARYTTVTSPWSPLMSDDKWLVSYAAAAPPATRTIETAATATHTERLA